MSECILDKRGKVAWLRLQRPERGNRLTASMVEELGALCAALADDDAVEIVVVTGTDDVFCCGLEYESSQEVGVSARRIREEFGNLQAVEALAALTKPTIAAINGDALGVGLELALACDLRLSVDTARFALPQVAEGLMPFCGGTQRLPRIVGTAKALELVLLGATIDAREAHSIGLVNEVIAPGAWATRVDEVLVGLLGKGPIALRLGKEAVLKALDLTLDQGMRLEEDLYALLQTTQDRAEGVQAFLQKRTPHFRGV
ncbi:MAG: enoyl-CoA hydratase/isomerase family protein [Deltaproteobacteria bacterium]|nr:enoyl-CoA hydratase/isomerase family protein [Deltaproteobacteria bacterium]